MRKLDFHCEFNVDWPSEKPMLGFAWKELLAKIPQEQHNMLCLVTSMGTEIAIQTVSRMENEYMVVRGRLAGTTDTGRCYFVPYDQINYIGTQKELKESQVLAIFGDQRALEVARQEEAREAAMRPDAPLNEPPSAVADATSPTPNPKSTPPEPSEKPKTLDRISIPSRESLRERLLARTQGAVPNKLTPKA